MTRVSRPAKLLPGDVILYLNHGTLGKLISWGAWTGKPKEALEYSHIGLVYDENQSFEMNPPSARLFPLDQVPWERVDVFRLNIGGVNPIAETAQGFKDFQVACRKMAGQDGKPAETYKYGTLASFLGLRVLGWLSPAAARWVLSKKNMTPGTHEDICSTAAEKALNAGIWGSFPGLDLIPDTGDDQARPSDFPASPYFVKVLV